MEDFIQILIWLFIIYNVVTAVFKSNKKRSESSKGAIDNPFENANENRTERRETGEFIDFFGMKIPVQKEENENRIDPDEGDDADPETWNPEEDFETEDETEPAQTPRTTSRNEFSVPEKEKINEMRELMAKAEQTTHDAEAENLFEETKTEQKTTANKNSPFLKTMRDKSELKRAVVMSEILNKPKALRKNG